MNYGKLAKSVLVPVVGGSLVGIFATRNSKEIYDKLKKPSFAPLPGLSPLLGPAFIRLWELRNIELHPKKKNRSPLNSSMILN